MVMLEDTGAAGGTVYPVGGPPLPMGRRLELPGRGITFVRQVEGPPGAPTLGSETTFPSSSSSTALNPPKEESGLPSMRPSPPGWSKQP